jgi:tetratricopeptide (TPR) repeat protein
MRSLRSPGLKCLLLAAFLGCVGAAHAACNGPRELVAKFNLHANPENAAVLGSWYASHQQFDCAIAVFRAGLKADPQSAQLHYLTGLALVATKEPNAALPELQKAIELEPNVLNPHLVLASVYEGMNKPEDAEREWRRGLVINPQSEPALEGLTSELMRRQDYAGVIQVLQNAPRTEKLTIRLSQALGILNDLDDAAAVLNDGIRAHPESVPLKQAMIVVLSKQRKHEDAIKLVQSILEKHPENEEVQAELFRLLVLSNHLDEARPLGAKLLKARPHDPEVLFLNGIVLRTTGDLARAKELLQEAVAIEPDFANSRYELGTTLVLLHEWQQGREQLEKSIQLGIPLPEAHFELAKALRGLGDNQGATEEVAKYQEIKKEGEARLEAVQAITQGDKAMEEGNFTEALSHYREAIAQQPQNPNYHFKLAIAMHRAGDAAGERRELEEAIRLDPKLPGPQNSLGYVLSRSGDADGAVEHFRRAVQAAPGWPEAWINLAAELATTAHFSEARQAVAKALELDPGNTQAKELSDRLAHDPAAQQNHP